MDAQMAHGTTRTLKAVTVALAPDVKVNSLVLRLSAGELTGQVAAQHALITLDYPHIEIRLPAFDAIEQGGEIRCAADRANLT